MILTVLNALIAIPQIAGYVESAIQGVIVWYVQRQGSETQQAIADAAALGARAQSDADRYAAAEAWQKALSRPRVTAA